MKKLQQIINWFTDNFKSVDGKQDVIRSMTREYGDDWLNVLLKGLEKESVRKDVAKILKLKSEQS